MMTVALKRVPIATSGLCLGSVALSSLMFHLNLQVAGICLFSISSFFLSIFLLKWMIYPKMFLTELKNIHTFAILPTLPMAIMIFASIIKIEFSIDSIILNILWYVSIILHLSLMIIFIMRYAFKNFKSWPNTSWFVMFVGIGVIGETGSSFSTTIGSIATVVGALFFAAILSYVLITKAWQQYNAEQFPMVVIMSAPAALTLNGVLDNAFIHSDLVIWIFFILSQSLFVFTLIFFPQIYKKGFKVSFAALTFPWVTTASSLYNTRHYFFGERRVMFLLDSLIYVELLFVMVVVIFVAYKYVRFIFDKHVIYG